MTGAPSWRRHKRLPAIDFKRDKLAFQDRGHHRVRSQPHRAHLPVNYADGEKRYILHPVGLKVGDDITSGPESEIRVGNCLPLQNIPEGSFIHNVELNPGKCGQMMRAAGAQARLMAKDAGYAQLKMGSGEIRLVPDACMATLGQVSNTDHNTVNLGKAGRSRHRGIRPTVRGGAMNATDHPMGGGRGKSKGGNHPRSPWNQLSKGFKTRSKKKVWGWMIVSDRRRAKQ